MSKRSLVVYSDEKIVGQLDENNGLWVFHYDETWMSQAYSFDIAPSLPRVKKTHRDTGTLRPVQWFFDNLLPEERLRELIANEAGSKNPHDAFALLEYLGQESAGSLTLLPPAAPLPEIGQLKPILYHELSNRINQLPKSSLVKGAIKRMSLAGAQHKMLLVIKGDGLYEPVGATASTHILKPEHPDKVMYPVSVFNEYLTMQLASAAGLVVPKTRILYIPQPVYIVDRFDRVFDDSDTTEAAQVQRRHLIDGCQLLNLDAGYKYLAATVENLNKIISICRNKMETRQRLFRWLVFNLIVGNNDNHLKNLSFFMTKDGVELAPHYDLLCTMAYETPAISDDTSINWLHASLAFGLPEINSYEDVSLERVVEVAKALHLPAPAARRIIKHVSGAVKSELQKQKENTVLQLKDHPMQARFFRVVELIIVKEMLAKL